MSEDDARADGLSLYVYYRVDPRRVDAARSSLAAEMTALQADWPQLRAEVLQRCDDDDAEVARDAPPTWMEVYRAPGGLGEACLADLRRRLADLPDGRLAGRHEERFRPFAQPAPGPTRDAS